MKLFSRTALLASLIAVVALAAMLSGCSTAGRGIPEPTGVAAETTETSVFYSTGRSLFEEKKVVDDKNVYVATLTKLLEATPESDSQVAIVQPTAKVLSVKVDKDGVATVDWSKDVLDFQATDAEKNLAWASIMMTLGQFQEIKQVRFTVEGKDSGQVGGMDVAKFWGRIPLKGQPWKAIRPPAPKSSSAAATGAATTTSTTGQ